MYPQTKIALIALLFAVANAQRCPPGDYTCEGSNPLQCGLESWRCDGTADCANGADEVGCDDGGGGDLDKDSECCRWASLCECEKNKAWMVPNCKRSCGTAEHSGDVNSAKINVHPDCKPTTDCSGGGGGGETGGGGKDELYIVYAEPPVNVNHVLKQIGVGPLNYDNVQVVNLAGQGGGGGGNYGSNGGGHGHHHGGGGGNYNHGKR